MIDRKDPLNLHSFIYSELLKKTGITHEYTPEIPHELSVHALLNETNRILENCVYAGTDRVKERNGENAEG